MASTGCESEYSTSHKDLKIRAYDIKFKLKVIDYSKEHGNHQAQKYFKIDRKRIREWRKKDEFRKVANPSLKKRYPGGGRKVGNVDIDAQVGSIKKKKHHWHN